MGVVGAAAICGSFQIYWLTANRAYGALYPDLCVFCCPPDVLPYASVCSASLKVRWLGVCEAPGLCSLEQPLGYELGNRVYISPLQRLPAVD